MINAHAQWRLDFARRISRRFQRFADLRAVVVGGSVARGCSDPYSDLEILLFWDSAPDPETRRRLMIDVRAEFRLPDADRGHDSALLIRGVPVDIWHNTVAHQNAALDRVLVEHSTDLEASNVLDTVRVCIPLYGEDLVQHWKTLAQAYPIELALRFLHAYLPHFHLRQLNLAARRDNPMAFYHTLTDIQCSLFLVLLALNRSYFPTFKWMFHTLEDLRIGPSRLGPRLRRMFQVSPVDAAWQLHAVLSETLAIVETQYPQLDSSDIAWARYILEQPARPYQAPSFDLDA